MYLYQKRGILLRLALIWHNEKSNVKFSRFINCVNKTEQTCNPAILSTA